MTIVLGGKEGGESPLMPLTSKFNGFADIPAHISVVRPALTISAKRKQCAYEEPKPVGVREQLQQNLKESCTCTREKLINFLYAKLPILGWLLHYDIKNWLASDVIAGITIAIFHIPQGMGFALLAYVPAICGIYMAFYPVLIYAIFATSRHNSMGSFAVITLMTGKVVKELATFPPEAGVVSGVLSNFTNVESVTEVTESFTESITEVASMISPDVITYTPIQVATVVCFMVGFWQLIFGVLQLGSLGVFLSDMLVSGFTTAAAVHVLTSQLKDLLGITIQGFSGPLKIIYTYIEIGKAIPTVNLATLIVTCITIGVLCANNEILKPIVSKYTRFPVPVELIAVIVGTAVSHYGRLTEQFEVAIVGDIPTGLPPPTVPPLELFQKVAVDSFVIAIVAYTVSFSLAKIFAQKNNYEVDASQEMYANSFGNLFSSFFACPPMASALARTIIQDAVGGKTQMASLVCCAVTIFVLLFIGPLFESLPKACLASIIVVALKTMFMQFGDMINMWKVSRIEAITWLVTFFSVVIIDIDFGLLIGIVFSLFVLLARNQSPATQKLGKVPGTDLYLDVKNYPQALEIPGICIFKITGSIHFANRENIRDVIASKTGLDPQAILKIMEKKSIKYEADQESLEEHSVSNGMTYNLDIHEARVRFLILDVSGLSYVDSAGGKFLEQLRAKYEKADINLCIAGLSENVLDMLERCSCLKEFPPAHLFHSVHDAVTILTGHLDCKL